jgi:mRNA-decapping enzyme subunit 2
MDANFEPRTRKEISKIQWYKLSELPTQKKVKQQHQEGRSEDLAVNANKFYMVAPFLTPLKKWISQQKKRDSMQVHPRNASMSAVQDSSVPLESRSLGTKAVVSPPESDDMNRLMNQLRTSSQVKNLADLAELSGPESSNGGITHLKNGQVPPPNASNGTHSINRTMKPQEDKAKAMLSLLRSGVKTEPSQSELASQQPQTPLEQFVEPALPPSPKHPFSRTPLTRNLPPPPRFPYSTNQDGKPVGERASHIPSKLSQAPGPLQDHAYQQPPAYKVNTTHPYPTMSQSKNHPLAPYQRTGDPQFAEGPRHLQNQPSSIPPANALPPPKLTAHSSALLNLFKSPNPPAAVHLATRQLPMEDAKGYSEQTDRMNLTAGKADSGLPQVPVSQQRKTTQPPTAPEPLEETQDTMASKLRSPHQEALLSLFKAPSSSTVPKAHTATPSLAPPTTLVELSAQPSPSHSRASSNTKKDTLEARLLSGHVTIQKRPDMSPKPAHTPVSATVTGPLPFPQFEQMAKKPVDSKVAFSASISSDSGHRTAKFRIQPTTILPRPMVEGILEGHLDKQGAVSPKIPREHQSRTGSVPASTITEPSSQKKPFQPQLLRRPKDPQPTQELPRLKSPALTPGLIPPSTVPLRDNISSDRRRNDTEEQKSALLSLLTKTQSQLSPPTPERLETASSTSAKQALPDHVLPSPLEKPKSRLGSLTSVLTDTASNGSGGVRIVNSKETSKASPVDKKFLLGYLAGVVKEGK